MSELRSDNINELLVLAARELLLNGKKVSPRSNEALELINQVLVLTNPRNNLVTLKSRKFSIDYLRAELAWYNKGELTIDGIKSHAKMWAQIVDKNGKINSNYGYYVFRELSWIWIFRFAFEIFASVWIFNNWDFLIKTINQWI
jgi:thymidylate synthase